jgi:hypothetical protein
MSFEVIDLMTSVIPSSAEKEGVCDFETCTNCRVQTPCDDNGQCSAFTCQGKPTVDPESQPLPPCDNTNIPCDPASWGPPGSNECPPSPSDECPAPSDECPPCDDTDPKLASPEQHAASELSALRQLMGERFRQVDASRN